MIMQGLQSIVDFVMQYAVTLAALSVLTVALIEAYKKVFSILPKFHQSAVQRWLQEDDKPPSGSDSVVMPDIKLKGHYGCTPATRAEKAPSGPPYEWRSAYDELLHLTTGLKLGSFKPELPKDNAGFTRNISFALFELELARMMAQVQEAADACVNNPKRYEHLFEFLTRGCDYKKDLKPWLDEFDGTQDKPVLLTQNKREELAEVYGRIRLLVRRQLDSFQTVTSYRWREWNQFWAWVVGGVLLLIAQLLQASAPLTLGSVGRMGMVSLLGGILAPVAKDLVDALASFKSRG